ncbi:MAG: molybdopterin molybdotransferase MoeA [Elusimicrobiales bacterium]|nr:molybdopterin molybdotransferase MoeA [Elusimicrobiales bacterium]
MITFEEAMEVVMKSARPLPPVLVRVEDAVGRALAEEIRSALDMPPFDKSAVDGYAVRAADVKPGRGFRCLGLIQAGKSFRGRLASGCCVKIMTGAPVPAGADAVIMVEYSAESGGLVWFSKNAGKRDNIALRGEDIKKGRVIMRRGTVIGAQHVAALAAAGRGTVKCGRLPSVSLINTGGEIVPPGKPLGKDRIYNSNGPMLSALLKADGIGAAPVIVRDEHKKLRAALAKALKADIALVSGGVSMGDYDLVPGVLEELGVKKLFHAVRVRPGKPMFFGVRGRTLVFGIPGNPVANFMAYLAYIRPAIRKMAGRPDFAPVFLDGVCAAAFEPRTPRRAMMLSTVGVDARFSLKEISNNGSADILALAAAGGFTMVKENGAVKKGEKAKFISWL